jgi:3-oxoacyl-[acyl-carrier protein] reductase
VYGLVNNAPLRTEGLLVTMPNGEFERLRLLPVNVRSLITLTKYVVLTMMACGGGRIVNIGSIVGSTGYSGLLVYSATTASIQGFTRTPAREVGLLGITVDAVAPGFIATDMTQSLGLDHRAQVAQ